MSTSTLVALDSDQLRSSFANLTASQQEWLLARRYYDTDKECCIALGRDEGYASTTKRSSSNFRYCYDVLLKGDPTLVDEELVEALTRSNLLKALIEERSILDMNWVDAAEQKLGTAKASAVRDAISRVKGPKRTEEHIYRMDDIVKVIEGSAVSVD